eukprot:GFUD01043950.1.p1 GENE.GFUD01043950.1~~GFUD01043950.1.p1  ORF type:complete len:213 (+),score=56.07 GFUD01043950.1:223-861(+)
MNLFRMLGDLSHYLAIITIFIKIIRSKSCQGISGKSQILFLFVFITRYLDIFTNFISMYNTSIKIFFILSTLTNIFLVFVKYKGTISSDLDTFRIEFLLLGAALLALFINHEFVVMEVFWTFSVYLEAVSIIPQLSVSSQGKSVEPVMLLYLAALGCHKLFYIFNWIHRYYNEGFYDFIAVSAGIVQTAIYANFFVLHAIKRLADLKSESSV